MSTTVFSASSSSPTSSSSPSFALSVRSVPALSLLRSPSSPNMLPLGCAPDLSGTGLANEVVMSPNSASILSSVNKSCIPFSFVNWRVRPGAPGVFQNASSLESDDLIGVVVSVGFVREDIGLVDGMRPRLRVKISFCPTQQNDKYQRHDTRRSRKELTRFLSSSIRACASLILSSSSAVIAFGSRSRPVASPDAPAF